MPIGLTATYGEDPHVIAAGGQYIVTWSNNAAAKLLTVSNSGIPGIETEISTPATFGDYVIGVASNASSLMGAWRATGTSRGGFVARNLGLDGRPLAPEQALGSRILSTRAFLNWNPRSSVWNLIRTTPNLTELTTFTSSLTDSQNLSLAAFDLGFAALRSSDGAYALVRTQNQAIMLSLFDAGGGRLAQERSIASGNIMAVAWSGNDLVLLFRDLGQAVVLQLNRSDGTFQEITLATAQAANVAGELIAMGELWLVHWGDQVATVSQDFSERTQALQLAWPYTRGAWGGPNAAFVYGGPGDLVMMELITCE